MAAIIECDHVFDVLTRAPFPSGGSEDSAVERHLASCHDCRRLAEALRPAIGLFHETLQAERELLPRYSGRVEQAAARVEERHTRQAGWQSKWVFAGAACLLTACVLLRAPQLRSPAVPRPVPGPALTEWTAARSAGHAWHHLQLPLACGSPSRAAPPEDDAELCCTRCHHAHSTRVSSHRAIARAVEACGICHREPPRTGSRGAASLRDALSQAPVDLRIRAARG